MFDLTDRVAIVTGGSRGIGRACAIALGAAGARVVINYQTNQAAAEEAVTEVERTGGRAEALSFDVADASAVEDAIAGVAKRFGRLDILVNNAGIARDALLMRAKKEEFEATLGINLGGALWCAKAAIRPMMRGKHGRIINLSSVVAEAGNPGQAVYASSKAALLGLTKTLAREYASRGITVNAVAPGFIATDMTAELPEEAQKHIVEQTPVGRVGTPQEVAAAVLFLASDESSYVTGQVLRVNGGMYV